jgi:hypothetical protein
MKLDRAFQAMTLALVARFGIGLTDDEKADLVAFLLTL